jgi:hypothetical protein
MGWFIDLIVHLFSLFVNKKSAIQTESEAAGAYKQDAGNAEAQTRTEAAIAQAEARAPTTVTQAENRLNQGTF